MCSAVCSVSRFVSENDSITLLCGSIVEGKALLILSSIWAVDRGSGILDVYLSVLKDDVVARVGSKFVKPVNDADCSVCPKSVDNDGMSDFNTN